MTDIKENPAKVHNVTPGSIFEMSWGYDQTNVDWYQVVNVSPSGKTVKIVRVRASQVDDDRVSPDTTAPYGECGGCSQYFTVVDNGPDEAPSYTHRQRNNDGGGQGPECYNGNGVARPAVLTKRLLSSGSSVFLNMTSYANAYLWDGATKYRTPLGFGH